MMQLTGQELQSLKNQGFNQSQINEALAEIEQEDLQGRFGDAQTKRTSDPRQFSQHSAFSVTPDSNMIKWELELNDILEKMEHILKGDVPKFKEGHMIWDVCPHPEQNILNEHGVQEIMRVLAIYVNRDTILADYEPQEIKEIVFDFGREINNLVFMKYEKMGLDTESKRNGYPMLIRELVDITHSTLTRAKFGQTARNLNTSRFVNQNENVNPQGNITVNAAGGNTGMKERGLLNPMRYISGKFKT
jgi:hypothetical protein